MQVRFWGTRGSLAKPGPSTIRYGGNTSCVEVRTADGTLLVLDCGTGGHELGQHLLREGPQPARGNLLISHTHWDHIQGIPFFAPFFVPGNEWDIYAPQGFGETLRATLSGQMEYTYFPVTPDAFGATIRYHNVSEGAFMIGGVRIRTRFLNHPALTIAYRIEADGAALVYACDHEPHSGEAALAGGEIAGQDEAHSEFLRDADLVIHDAQYTPAEYPSKTGWGHSTAQYAAAVCARAGVRRLALTHHDPLRHDDEVDALLAEARSELAAGARLEIMAAAEGLVIEVAGAEGHRPSSTREDGSGQSALAMSEVMLAVSRSEAFHAMVEAAASAETRGVRRLATLTDVADACAAERPPLIVVDGALLAGEEGVPDTLPSEVPLLVIGGASVPARGNSEHLQADVSGQYLRSRIRTWLMRGKYAAVPAAIPEDEAARLAALRSTRLLDTPPEERFDRLTRIAARLFDAPISLLTLIDEDRQWFKSRVGIDTEQTPRDVAFCAHAILRSGPLIVHDALNDERFATNPLVLGGPRIRFYAGIPVKVDNQPVGTFCLIDTKPRAPSDDEVQMLKDLAALAQAELGRQC